MLTNVIYKLSGLKDKKVFFEPLGGNNGDTLIEMGARYVLEDLQIKLVTNPEQADVILVNGSGDLTYIPASKPIEESRQASYLIKYPHTPIILLPSSCTSINANRLKPILAARKAPTSLLARDKTSFSYFQEVQSSLVEVLLDHDMAFGLIDSPWLNNLKKSSSAESLLIVERFDAEGATKPPMIYKTPVSVRALVPGWLKSMIKKKVLAKVHSATPFVDAAKEKVVELFPDISYKQVKAADISLPQNHSMEDFCYEVSKASIVVSTRLHVCILASLLGKPLIAVQFQGGTKLSSCFDNSLKLFPNSKLWVKNRED